MAQTPLPVLSGAINADPAGTSNTLAQRDGSGGLTVATLYSSLLANTGGATLGTASRTTSFTANTSAVFYACSASGGAITATIPLASISAGVVFCFKKTDSSGNAVTVTASGSDTIDGASTKAISTQYNVIRVYSDGTVWWTW